MSLLQEALKRKEQNDFQHKPEAGSTENVSSASPANDVNLSAVGQQAAEVKNTGDPLSSPPQSMPVAGQNQAAISQSIIRKAPLLWIIMAVIAVFIALTFTAGIVFLFYRVLSPAKVKTVQQAGPVNNTTAVAAGGTNILSGQPISALRPESATVAEITAYQAVAPDANKETTSAIAQNAETKSAQQQSAGNAESKPAPAKPAFFKPKAPPAVSQAARWPALKLTGILRGAEKTESTAFINGKMISPGQAIADVTIVEIQADGVILKYGNEKRFLRVGATSY